MEYYHQWIDPSFGNAVVGHRMTLDSRSGALLQTAMTTMVGIGGSAAWDGIKYVIFRVKIHTPMTDVEGAYFRLVFANSGTAFGDATTLFKVAISARGHARHGFRRASLWGLLPVGIRVSFIGASLLLFLVTVPSYKSDISPILPGACGLRKYNVQTPEGILARANAIIEDTLIAQTRVKECYGETPDPLACKDLPLVKLLHTSKNVSCPWINNRCTLDYALQIESNLDSYEHLGILASGEDRVTVRIKSISSVINYADVLKKTVDNTTNGEYNLWRLYFGAIPGVSPYTWQYSEHSRNTAFGYEIQPFWFPAQGGELQVIPSMRRSDGDLTLAMFTPNGARYLAPNRDPLFSANGSSTATTGLVLPDDYVKVIASLFQVSLHNPNNNISTILTSPYTVDYESIGLTAVQKATAKRILAGLLYMDAYYCITGLSGNSLLATSKLWDFVSPGLPDDQWAKEVQHLFEVGLAKLAQSMVNYPNQPLINSDYVTIQAPDTPEMMDQCATTLGSTLGAHQTFITLGVVITLAVSALLFLLSLTLSWCTNIRGGPRTDAEIGYNNVHILAENLQGHGHGNLINMDKATPMSTIQDENIGLPTAVDGVINFPPPVQEHADPIQQPDDSDSDSDAGTDANTEIDTGNNTENEAAAKYDREEEEILNFQEDGSHELTPLNTAPQGHL